MADTNCGRMGRFLRNVFFLRERKLESCITGQVLMLFPIPFRSLKMALLLFAGVTFAQAHQVVMRPGQSVVKALATPGLTKLSVEPGHYFLEEPIVLGPNHKGLEITADGGEVVLSGGIPLSGWRQVEGEENLWAVSGGWSDREAAFSLGKGADAALANSERGVAAGIYTLGRVEKMRIEENYVHDIIRAGTAIASGSSGIFFDQYSGGTTTRRNVLRRIDNWGSGSSREPHPIKHNMNEPSEHRF